MRLLNTTTRCLHDFPSSNVPNYAILSHTWAEPQDEVLFVDMERGLAEKKAGYKKLRWACDQASTDEFSWIWVDTCCIDKNSSAELSEAINSMYKWYLNAMTCYAYLADVPSTADVNSLTSEFATSRWFGRGWTLQELIAPSSLIFFSEHWEPIGTKSTLYSNLSKITGIDLDVLIGTRSLDSISVANKMSWASRRQTGRPEDIAYCLMGLFNVNMPMLYGEGDKAFLRLQEEIMKYSDDQSLFAWQDPNAFQGSYHGLLAKHPKNFFNSRNIVPYRDWEARTPFSMSNRGLCIELHLSRYSYVQDIYVAALDCPAPDNFEGFLGIYLKRISSGDRQYARIRPEEFCKIPVRGNLETLYIRQQVIVPTHQDIYPTHAIQLSKGPSGDDYKLVDIVVDPAFMTGSIHKLGATLNSIEPARARSWVPKGLPFVFQVVKGAIQLSGALIFERIDGERLIVMLGSTSDFGIGFDVAPLPTDEKLPIEGRLWYEPKELGEYVIVRDHRVRVDATIQVLSGIKYYMVDVTVEAIMETPTGIVRKVIPRLQRLADGIQANARQNNVPTKPSDPPRGYLRGLFKSGEQKQPKAGSS